MRKPHLDMNIFRQRRKQAAERLKGSALILFSHPDQIRNYDVHQPYRQDSNFFYLTGFEEPGAIFLLIPGKHPESVLFVRNKDPERETWDGFRYGPPGAKDHFAVDAAFSIDDFQKEAPSLLRGVERIYHSLYQNPSADEGVKRLLEGIKGLQPRRSGGILTISDASEFLSEMRIRKTEVEVEWMRKACAHSAAAHVAVMKATRPGVNERELHGLFIHEIMRHGCARQGYNGIFAAGANGTTLHYVFNDQPLRDGDLLLVDAGGEFNYYTGDITRTYPVNGKFSPSQKRLYSQILDLQKKLIQMVKPGTTFTDLQDETVRGLTAIMLEAGILVGDSERLIKDLEYRRYYPHSIGHWLGMDVHDAGLMRIGEEPRRFEAGMVVTIEPGLYIPAHDERVPKEFRGIGIRIEDDILVTAVGCENLTLSAPKEIDALEDVIGSA